MAPWDQVMSQLNKDALLQRASSLADGALCHFIDAPLYRTDWVILMIEFPDEDKRWAARIPLDQEFSFLEISVRPLQFIARKHPSLPAPRLYGYFDAGAVGDNPVGVAYMLVDWIEGRHMEPWTLDSPPVPMRHRVLEQLADMMLEMLLENAVDEDILYYGVPDSTPKHTSVSTTSWLTESIDRALRRNLRQRKTALVFDYLIQRSMIPHHVVTEYDHSPWVVVHPDLHHANIIIDNEFNVLGLIDWDFAFAQPLQKCAVFPKLLENVPGGAPPDIPGPLAYLDLPADKTFFLSALAEKEKQRSGTTKITRLIESSSTRNFFELSHHVATVHQEFAVRFCTRSRENLAAAMEEIEDFLADNTGFSRDDPVIVEVVKSIRDQLASSLVE